jgi:hypothetical protein
MPVFGAARGDCSEALLLLPSHLVALRKSKGFPKNPHVLSVGVAIVVVDNVDRAEKECSNRVFELAKK